MIHLQVIRVSRHKSAVVDTTVVKWDGDKCQKERKAGGEWEEVELQVEMENHPTIEVANVAGDYFIANNGGTIKIVINNPILFGCLKINEVIALATKREPIN